MIGHQLTLQAARRPRDTAIVFGARRLSYAELHARACRLAQALTALGVGPGDRVATLMHNCTVCLESLFATAMLGAVHVPLNFRLVAREIGPQLRGCTPKVLLAGAGFAEVVALLRADADFPPHLRWVDDQPPTSNAPGDCEYEAWIADHPAEEPPQPALPAGEESVQMLLHSSGTTGTPKGVVFTHAGTLASCSAKIIDFALTPADVTVVFGPLFHAGPLMDLVLPLLLRGGRVVIGASRQFDPQRLMQTVATERGTVIPIYPTMLRRLLAQPAEPDLDLSSLRLIITGGENCPVPVILGMHERFAQVEFINNYGSTEGGPITTFLPAAESLSKTGSVGREAFSVELRIVDEQYRPLPEGAVGEIVVRSPVVCRGYWNRPAESAAQLHDGWWSTGDLGWRDEDGCLWIAGRRKDMIKSGTENVYPIEVEQAIAALDGVIEVGVIGVPDEEWGETVVAYIVADPAAGIDAERVVAHCREHLAGYKKPRHVVFVDSLPRGTTSKVAKQVLRRLWDEACRAG